MGADRGVVLPTCNSVAPQQVGPTEKNGDSELDRQAAQGFRCEDHNLVCVRLNLCSYPLCASPEGQVPRRMRNHLHVPLACVVPHLPQIDASESARATNRRK